MIIFFNSSGLNVCNISFNLIYLFFVVFNPAYLLLFIFTIFTFYDEILLDAYIRLLCSLIIVKYILGLFNSNSLGLLDLKVYLDS